MIATAADGTRLHYVVEGTGPPLVLVGGRTSTIEGAWWRYIPALSPRFTVIALDNRGTGGFDQARRPDNTAVVAGGAPAVPHDSAGTGRQAAQPVQPAGRNPPTGTHPPWAAGSNGAGCARGRTATRPTERSAPRAGPGRSPGPLRTVCHRAASGAGLHRGG